MVARVQETTSVGKGVEKEEPLALLVEMQTAAAILENSMEGPQRVKIGAPGWLIQLSIQLLISAKVFISWFMRLSPASGSTLTALILLGILSPPPLSAPAPNHTHTHSQMNIFKKLKIELPYHSAIAVLGIYPKNTKIPIQKDTCTPMFIAALPQQPKYGRSPNGH